MGMTSQSAAARLIQPGVIANASERPASPYEGQCIFQKDTDQLLVWNGSAWVIPNAPAQNPTGLELIKTATVTGANPSIADAFNSNYTNYKLLFSNLQCSNDTNIYLRMGTTAGTNYYWAGINREWVAASTAGYQGNATSQWATGMVGTDARKGGGWVELQSPNAAQPTTFSSQGGDVRTNGAGAVSYSGFLNDTTQYTSFSLLCDGAVTYTSCTIEIYGYRK